MAFSIDHTRIGRWMTRPNRLWHEQHRMPKNPTPEQRIAWHLEHATHCRCRPIPNGVAALMQARGIKPPEFVDPPERGP
jgi:hypothetical protein